MLGVLSSAWKVADLRRKLIFTFLMLLVFRIGIFIPVPGIDKAVIRDLIAQGQLLGFFNIMSGGAFENFSIFAMSITPYINASIIINLLTVVIPYFERLSKEGPDGRKKIGEYTRYGAVILGAVQALGISIGLRSAVINPGVGSTLIIIITLTAGTAFLMWLGELKMCIRDSPHAYMRKFGMCRICFRELAYEGQIPGVTKASW